ncbi:SDR family oxidoreductase [Streptomyces griseoincarnatus]|uniref:SDR family oxidoreductase n=1 Tax=Streptomyces sp. NPDC013172 TaxID=3155009 RepID=UPI0033CAD903
MTTQERSGQRIVIIGAGSAIGRQLARTASDEGAELVLAGPDLGRLKETGGELTGEWRAVQFDITDDDSIARLADEVGPFDHLVSTAAVPANGPLAELDPTAVRRAFAAKVVGPLFIAKSLVGQAREGGSFTFFSGVAAWRPAPERTVMATTNGALAFLVQALAVEIAPLRVNAVSPGIVDSGAWDKLGDAKPGFLQQIAENNPVRRVGTPQDVVKAVLFAMDNPYVTGTVLHVDGGARLA